MSWAGSKHEWDVFVSYAHGKPARGREEARLKGWTRAFVTALEEDINHAIEGKLSEETDNNLNEYLGDIEQNSVSVWYDQYNIDGNDHLTKQLRSAMQKSALLVVIMSPEYLNSRWCNKELSWFEDELESRGEGGIRSIFVAHVMPTQSRRWPGILKDENDETVPGFKFYPTNKEEGKARPFGYPVQVNEDILEPRFHDILPEMTAGIAERLIEIREETTAPVAGSGKSEEPPVPASRGPIYLAPSTSLLKTRNTIRIGLEKAGVEILPDEEMTLDLLTPEDFQAAIEKSRVFAQILGTDPHPSKSWDGCAVSGQYNLALKADKPCVIYCKPELIKMLDDDDEYQKFVETVTGDSQSSADGTVAAILAALEAEPTKSVSAYMHCPPGQHKEFYSTKQKIEEGKKCRVQPYKIIDENETLGQLVNDAKRRFTIYDFCDGVLFLNIAQSPQGWLRNQLEELEEDRMAVKDPVRLRGLVLDCAGNAQAAQAVFEDVEVVPWPTEDPSVVDTWLRRNQL